jgi:hypothetical protein
VAVRIETFFDDEMGCIADGVYMAVDEASFFEATGELLPPRTANDETPGHSEE